MNGETIYSLLHDFRIMSLTVKSSFLLYLQEIDIHENINFCFNRLTLSLVIIKALNTTINLNIWILKHLGLPILLFIMNFLLQKENVVLYNHVKFNIKRNYKYFVSKAQGDIKFALLKHVKRYFTALIPESVCSLSA